MPKQTRKEKADPREQALERGRTLLAAWGIHAGALPPGTPGPQVVATLSPLIGRDAACDLLIAEWLGRTPDAAAAARLVEWEATASDKELKREIRRALFKLEQRGILVERREEIRTPFTLGVKPSEPEGYLGAIDGDGSRMAWLIKKDSGGGCTGLFAILHDTEGMVSLSAGSITRQRLGEALKEMASSATGAPARIPWLYVDSLMVAAFRKAAPRPGNARADYLLARSEFTSSEGAPVPTCPVVDSIPAEKTEGADLLDASAELFKEKELGTWALPAEAARKHLQKLADLDGSGLVLSKETMTERMTAILDEALEDFVASPLRDIFRRRLEETAYVFQSQGRERPALLSLAVARALATPEGRQWKPISFLRAFVFRAFLPHMMRRQSAAGGHDHEGHDHAGHDHAAHGEAPPSETAEGSTRILDPSKVRETGVQGAGPVDDAAPPGLIIRP